MSQVLHRSLARRPPIVTHGEGVWMHLADGRAILDASGGPAVVCLGYGNTRVAEAIGAQALKMPYSNTMTFSSEPAEALAELLVGDRPGGLTHAFFVSSGSAAMEAALKLARQYMVERGQAERVHFISRRQSYHGNFLGSLAASGQAKRRALYEAILPPHFSQVSPCFAFRYRQDGEDDTGYVARLAAELEAEFQRIGPDRVIAFVAETVVGATAGCVTALPGYFGAMREVCDRHGALLILDEIMCGMGRTGTTHAWEQEGVTPDIQAIAKGLGGGYASIGGILIAGHVIDALAAGTGGFVHGQTYQAHPVGCAAALEVQRIIREEALVARAQRLGTVLETRLREQFDRHPFVGDIRGRGLFWALEFVEDRATSRAFDPEQGVAERVKEAGLQQGVGVYVNNGVIDGTAGDCAIISPPYIVTEDEIDLAVKRLGRAVDTALGT